MAWNYNNNNEINLMLCIFFKYILKKKFNYKKKVFFRMKKI